MSQRLSVTSSDDSSSSSDEMDDVELLKNMSRQDLFSLIKTDPRYYLQLIKDNGLEDHLHIKMSRSEDGGCLTIRFRFYPDDEPIEVGYFSDVTDEEVLDEFVLQLGLLLGRSQGHTPAGALPPPRQPRQPRQVTKESISTSTSTSTSKRPHATSVRTGQSFSTSNNRAHLACQLIGNNDITSPEYGRDLDSELISPEKLNSLRVQQMSPLEQKILNFAPQRPEPTSIVPSPENIKDSLNAEEVNINTSKSASTSASGSHYTQTRRETMQTKPVDTLNNFIALILDKIGTNLPELIQIDKMHDYHSMINELSHMEPPKAYKVQHDKLLEKIKGYAYLQKVHHFAQWSKYPELHNDWIDFHQQAIKISPNLYLTIDKKALLDLLDEDDRDLLKQYNLDVQKLWTDYVLHN